MVWKNDQVSQGETEEILRVASEVLAAGVSGDFVEFGCYKGDTSLLLAEVLAEYNRGIEQKSCSISKLQGQNCGKLGEGAVEKSVEKVGKRLWIYDSFEGLPEKSGLDESVLGVDFKKGELTVSKREVKERFLRAGLKVPVIKKGWFSELEAKDLPSEVAFAFLDGDFYESIRDSLWLVENLMAEGGKILVHDYNNPALPGVARAVDEWMRGKDLKKRVVESMIVITT